MYTYRIPMKFKYASPDVCYADYAPALSQAQASFNAHAEKMRKARKITALDYETDGFVIYLTSQEPLVNPSKALAPFSRELAKLDEFAPLLDGQNHLLAANGAASQLDASPSHPDDSIGEILKTVVDIFLNAHITDSVFVTQGRKQAQKDITAICRTFRSLN